MAGQESCEQRIRFSALLAMLAPLALAHAAPASPPRELVLSGEVVDADGSPVPGAEVFFTWGSDRKGVEIPRTRSNGSGRFRLAAPMPEEYDIEHPHRQSWAHAWAYAPGRQVGWLDLGGLSWAPYAPVRFVLKRPGSFRVQVLDPDGKPVPSAIVSVASLRYRTNRWATDHFWGGVHLSPPDALHPHLTATSDARGIATVATVTPEEVGFIEVVAPGFGRQGCWNPQMENRPDQWLVRLRPVGKLRGRVIAGEPEYVRGMSVAVRIEPSKEFPPYGIEQKAGEPPPPMRISASAQATTDAEGRFEIPALAEGWMSISMPDLRSAPWLSPPIPVREFPARGTTEIELRLARAVRIHGVLRDRATGKAPPDSGVASRQGIAMCSADGRYEFYHLPGKTRFWPKIGNGWKPLCVCGGREVMIPEGARELELPPFEVALASGRVLSPSGAPIGNAMVGVRVRSKEELESKDSVVNVLTEQFSWHVARTDDHGQYRMWVGCEEGTATLVAVAPGYRGAVMEWPMTKRLETAIPNLVMTPAGRTALTGRVIDRQGKPVADAAVFLRPEPPEWEAAEPHGRGFRPKPSRTKTDAEGRFCLEGVRRGGEPFFVEKCGYRFWGQWIDEATDRVEVVLSRHDEPPRRMLKSLAPPVSRADRVAAAMPLVESRLEKLLKAKEEDGSSASMVSYFLVETHRQRASRLLKDGSLKHEYLRVYFELALRRQSAVAGSSVSSLPPEATPEERLTAILKDLDRLPPQDRGQRQELLTQAKAQLLEVKKPAARLVLMGAIAERLLDFGDREEAGRLYREGQSLTKSFDGDACAKARCDFAQRLARYDLAAAEEIAKHLGTFQTPDALDMIARLWARKKPEEAERILGQLRRDHPGDWPDQCAAWVCSRMASVDFARARRIAEEVGPGYLKAAILIFMARAVHKSDPKTASALVQQALDELEEQVKKQPDGKYPLITAALLPVIEQIDPRLLDEALWRAVSFRLAPEEDPDKTVGIGIWAAPCPSGQVDVCLAALLARYDRHLAQQLFPAAWKSLPEEYRAYSIQAAAVLDPKQAAASLKHFDRNIANNHTPDFLRLAAAEDAKLWDVLGGEIQWEAAISEDDLEQLDRPLPLPSPAEFVY